VKIVRGVIVKPRHMSTRQSRQCGDCRRISFRKTRRWVSSAERRNGRESEVHRHSVPGALFIAAIALSAIPYQSICSAEGIVPPKRFILSGASGESLVHQCSRAEPQGVTGFWAPSAPDLDDLEAKLPAALAKSEFPEIGQPNLLEKYHRQYVGITIANEKFIYGNYYQPESFLERTEAMEAVHVCDGGPFFFGVTYRMGTRAIDQIDFNGMP